jgi:hypothetical protein
MLRLLYRRAGGNESVFSLDCDAFDAGITSADMALCRARYAAALNQCADDALPELSSDNLTTAYPGLNQSIAQVIHSTDERCKSALE